MSETDVTTPASGSTTDGSFSCLESHATSLEPRVQVHRGGVLVRHIVTQRIDKTVDSGTSEEA